MIASGSSGNCYKVSDGVTDILLDAGISAGKISRGVGFGLSKAEGCLVTHEHGDHCAAANVLGDKYGIPVYLSEGTIRGSQDKPWAVKTKMAQTIRAMKTFEVGSFTVLPFDVEHDAKEPLGFLMKSKATGEKLLYFTDTYYIKYKFSGVTHLMAECNYVASILNENIAAKTMPRVRAKRILNSHMSLEHLLDFLDALDRSKLQQIYLIHISKDNGYPEDMIYSVRAKTGVEVYAYE